MHSVRLTNGSRVIQLNIRANSREEAIEQARELLSTLWTVVDEDLAA